MLSRFYRNAEPQRRAAKHLGHTWYIGKRFCKSRCVIFSTLSAGIEFMEFRYRRAALQWKRVKVEHKIKIRDASLDSQQKNQSSSVEKTLQRIMGQTNNDCRFQISISKFPTEVMHGSKKWKWLIQLIDSVDDLMSSSSTRGSQMPNFDVLDARIASALNKIIHNSHFKKKNQSGGTKGPETGPFPSRKTDCLLDLWVLPGHWSQRFCRELCRPIHYWFSKWRSSGIRFKVGRNFIVNNVNPIWWHFGRIVQIKNTRVWETQDRIGIVWPGDSSEENRTWLTQIEDDGDKKNRTESTK